MRIPIAILRSLARTLMATVLVVGSLVVVSHPGAAQAGTPTPCGTAPPGTNVIVSNAAVINGTSGDDYICAGNGANVIIAGAGDDIVYARGGQDLVRGGPGEDSIWGGSGSDELLGGPHQDRLWGGLGRDLLKGGGAHDRLWGGVGKDALHGQGGPDRDDGGPQTDACVSAANQLNCEMECPAGSFVPTGLTDISTRVADLDGNGLQDRAWTYRDPAGDLWGAVRWDDGGYGATRWEDTGLLVLDYPVDVLNLSRTVHATGVTGEFIIGAEPDGSPLLGTEWLVRASKDTCSIGFVGEANSDGFIKWPFVIGEVLSGAGLGCEPTTPDAVDLWPSSWTVDVGSGDVTELVAELSFLGADGTIADYVNANSIVVGNVGDPSYQPQQTYAFPTC